MFKKSLIHYKDFNYFACEDRTKDNIPEMSLKNIEFIFGVGGNEKKNSLAQF